MTGLLRQHWHLAPLWCLLSTVLFGLAGVLVGTFALLPFGVDPLHAGAVGAGFCYFVLNMAVLELY